MENTVRLIRSTLSDGSHVFNVNIHDAENTISIDCADEAHANALMEQFQKTSFFELDPMYFDANGNRE